jgi:hypothetical protein
MLRVHFVEKNDSGRVRMPCNMWKVVSAPDVVAQIMHVNRSINLHPINALCNDTSITFQELRMEIMMMTMFQSFLTVALIVPETLGI